MPIVEIEVNGKPIRVEVPNTDSATLDDVAQHLQSQQPASTEAAPSRTSSSLEASSQPASLSAGGLSQLAPPTGPQALSPEDWAQVEQTAKGLPPMAMRVGGAIGGNVAGAGALATGNIPLAIAARAGIPFLADAMAQGTENLLGTRDGYNWKRGAAEVGAAQLAGTGLIRGGITGLGVNEITSRSEGHIPTLSERLWATVFGSTIGAVANRGIKSQNIQNDAEELMRLYQMEEAAKDSVTGIHQAEIMPERPVQELPRAEATKVEEPRVGPAGEVKLLPPPSPENLPQYIQDDFNEMNAKFTVPSEGPDNVNAVAVRDIIGGGGGLEKSPPRSGYNPFGRLQIEDQRLTFKRSKRSDLGATPMIEDVARMDKNTGLGVYADHRELRKADQNLKVFKDQYIRDSKEPVFNQTRRGAEWIFTGTDEAKRKQYTGWLEAKDKEAFETANGFSHKDKIAVRNLRLLYNDLFKQFGIDGDMYLQDYAPHIRTMTADQMATFLGDPKVPGEYKFFAEMMRTGEMTQYQEDSLQAFSEYLNRGSFKKFMAEPWDRMYKKYSPLAGEPDPYSGAIDSASTDPATREAGTKMVDMLKHYRYRTPDRFGQFMENVAADINSLTKKITGKEGRLTRHDLVSGLTQAQTAGLLAGRPKAVIQNFNQVLTIAGSRLGPKWLVRGIKAANTPEGKMLAEQAGVTSQGIRDIAELHQITSNRAKQALSRFTDVGMKYFTNVEEWGRTTVYNGQYLKTLSAAKKAKNVDEFISMSDADMMPEPVQQMLKVSYMAGNVQKAADDAADYMVQSTLYDYGALGRPAALRRESGRVFGSYGVWPANYVSFAKSLYQYGPRAKRARDFGNFLALNGMVASLMVGGKRIFNDGSPNETQQADMIDAYVKPIAKEMGSQVLSPMAYSGGPAVEAVQQSGAYLRGKVSGYDTSDAARSLAKVGKAFIPGSRAYSNFMDAYQETDGFRQRPMAGIGQLFEMTDDGRIRRQQQMLRRATKVRGVR